MGENIECIIRKMTLAEKAGLCSGLDFWRTKSVDRLGIPSIVMSDGPHGLRKQAEAADHMGLHESVPATCFPPAATLACSWDRGLMQRVGTALGEECQAEDVSILLGPGANIKRSPLCGRNFEYFSEDPYLSGEMAANHIRGVQSQGVGTSLKHYAANNQEHARMTIDAVVDERTLREIYLASFESAVKQSQPWTVMCAYNKLNGTYCSEHAALLTGILKEEWGFSGFVVSDWGAVNDRAEGLCAGLDQEMPYAERDTLIVQAVQDGRLSEDILNRAVERILRVVFRAVKHKKENTAFDKEAHHGIARQAARESMVLLKNEDRILPLKKEGTIAVIGGFVRQPRYQGGGSSHINPTKVDDVYEEICQVAGDSVDMCYAQGYSMDAQPGAFSRIEFSSASDEADMTLIREAQDIAARSDVAVIFAGLPESYESEGFDRKHLRIPKGHSKLIEAVAEVQPNTVVVLSNGSPIEMPWIDCVKGVLEGYLGGQAWGGAVADLLFGDATPCGKLAETFPRRIEDTPAYLYFPGEKDSVEYREGLFVGYRYYDAKNVATLFPFGYGLSYTAFDYTDIIVVQSSEMVTVEVTVKNVGTIAGKEIVQLYVRDVVSSVTRPPKELKGFEKVALEPGEEKTVQFILDRRAFAYYDTDFHDWRVENGEFDILIGKSSADIVLSERILVRSTQPVRETYTRNTTVKDLIRDPDKAQVMEAELKEIMEVFDVQDLDENTLVSSMPLRAMISFCALTEERLQSILEKLNE